MTTYREFQQELERLHQKAESARRIEKGEALARIRSLIIEYQLLPSDLGLVDPTSRLRKIVAPAKYRDPDTGSTWTGRGRPPVWLAGKDRSAFLIGNQ